MNLLHLASCFGRRGDRVESPPIAWEGREANCKVQMCCVDSVVSQCTGHFTR